MARRWLMATPAGDPVICVLHAVVSTDRSSERTVGPPYNHTASYIARQTTERDCKPDGLVTINGRKSEERRSVYSVSDVGDASIGSRSVGSTSVDG